MITYVFECKCGHTFEMFRLGMHRLELWKQKKLRMACPACKSYEIKLIIPKGSGQFKKVKWH